MSAVAVFGDTAPPIQAGIAASVAAANPDAVVFLGDAVDRHGAWAGRRGLQRWTRDLAPLEGRLYAIAGNHDFGSDGGLDRYSAALETLRCPADRRERFALELDGIQLLGVTVGHRRAAVSADDLDWCDEHFRRSAPGAVKVLAVHQPLFPLAGRIGISLDADPENRDGLLSRLGAWGVRIVLCGHEHLYARRRIAPDIVQIASGGGGASAEKALFGHADCVANEPHYVVLTSQRDSLTVTASSIDGRLLDRFSVGVPG